MTKQQPNEKITSYALLGMTAVPGHYPQRKFSRTWARVYREHDGQATWYFSRSRQREYRGSLLNARSRL